MPYKGHGIEGITLLPQASSCYIYLDCRGLTNRPFFSFLSVFSEEDFYPAKNAYFTFFS
jgi:hypothetical protein